MDKVPSYSSCKTFETIVGTEKRVFIEKKVDERVLEETPIILANEDLKNLKKEKKNHFCKIVKAQAICKEILLQANRSEKWLILPDAEREICTDIHRYCGDIYLSNLKNRLNHDCAMTMGEINYIIGDVGKDTFSKHIIDFIVKPFQADRVIEAVKKVIG